MDERKVADAEIERFAEVLWKSDHPHPDDPTWADWLVYLKQRGNQPTLMRDVNDCRRRAAAFLAALRATGAGRAEAEAAGKSGLSNAELEAEALRYQAIAAKQGSTIMRLRIAMKLLTESGHGGAIHTARKWFAAGGTGPIPWPGGACFAAWAEEQGYSEVDGCVGFRMTARALPAQTAGGAGE